MPDPIVFNGAPLGACIVASAAYHAARKSGRARPRVLMPCGISPTLVLATCRARPDGSVSQAGTTQRGAILTHAGANSTRFSSDLTAGDGLTCATDLLVRGRVGTAQLTSVALCPPGTFRPEHAPAPTQLCPSCESSCNSTQLSRDPSRILA